MREIKTTAGDGRINAGDSISFIATNGAATGCGRIATVLNTRAKSALHGVGMEVEYKDRKSDLQMSKEVLPYETEIWWFIE